MLCLVLALCARSGGLALVQVSVDAARAGSTLHLHACRPRCPRGSPTRQQQGGVARRCSKEVQQEV